MTYLIGIDGGGTRTTLALADGAGREIVRRVGPPGLVDPRCPGDTAEMLAELAAETLAEAGVKPPVAALCAGLAGVGSAAEREIVRSSLAASGVAEQVVVRTDGETALEGALGGGAGLLLVAGTGSVAYGRSEDGRVDRCGGWGLVVGDEGSGYAIGRAGLQAVVRAVDGRGPSTGLLPRLLEEMGIPAPEGIPPWAGRAEKSEIAALAVPVLELAASGDAVAECIVAEEAQGLAEHAAALMRRLGPWGAPTRVVLHGGMTQDETYVRHLERALAEMELPVEIREPARDAVAGAVQFARAAAESRTEAECA
ncbi:MAG TPA: BadF/BadG/BcrA/BcrD ATPase family protein [Longimicrobiaceae bacterium]|nr:BadF/BadG/BcrA/BcrD ATPase family protein [Longimicrobiaceae bacterium]